MRAFLLVLGTALFSVVHAANPHYRWSLTVGPTEDGKNSFGEARAAGIAASTSLWQGNCGITNEGGSFPTWGITITGGTFCPDVRIDAYCDAGLGLDTTNRKCNVPPGAIAPQKNAALACLGNPCDPATGNKYEAETDYRGTGAFPLEFVRHYNSRPSSSATIGHNWRATYDRAVIFDPVVPNFAFVVRENNRSYTFRLTGGQWTPEGDVPDRLLKLMGGALHTGWQYTNAARDEVETYSAEGRLLTVANRAGVTHTLAYDNGNRLLSVTHSFGRSLAFAYDNSGRILTMTDPAGGVYGYAYDANNNNLVTVTYPDTRTRTYLYENTSLRNHLTGIIDENAQRFATYAYDAFGRAIVSEHAGGAERITISYDPGQAKVTDAFGVQRTYAHLVVLGVAKNTSVSGQPCSHCSFSPAATYDPNGYLASRSDWNGNKTCLVHDSRGLEILRGEGLTGSCPADLATWSPAGSTVERKITTEWHATWHLPIRVAEPKRITTFVYHGDGGASCGATGAVCSKTVQATNDTTGGQGLSASPVGTPRVWTYTYNASGQLLTVDGPRTDASDVTTFSYDASGNLTATTNALGQVTQITAYDAHGQPLTIVDPNGLATTFTYDARQRLTSKSMGGETTSYEYDGAGQLIRITLPDGSFLAYTYDAAHRLTEIADNLGNRIAYTLDAMGNRTREDVFDPASQLAQTRSRVYSNLNRLVKEIGGTNPATQITQYAYDNQGNVTSITDPLNRVTANAYDALNRIKQVTDPASGITGHGYDGLDQLVSVSDPRSNTTGYTLDGLGNLAAQSSPDTGTTTNTQDAAGNLVATTDTKGQSTSYTYDALNRVTRIVYNPATGTQLEQVDYAYDQGANGIGRLTSITETSAAAAVLQTTTYGYDQHGRALSETRAIGGQTYTTAYAFDAAGRMTGMTYPSGRTLAYGFDDLGRVNRIETTGGGETRVVVQDAAYHPFGPPKAFTFGNLQSHARIFDADGRIVSHTLASQTKALRFDAASRITRIEQQGQPADFANYGYDALDRLASAVLPTSTFAFGYDPVGNRLSKSIGGGTDTYTYPPTSNRLSAIAGSSGARTYAHDPNGSITSDGVNSFAYDVRGRLAQSVSAAGNTTYQVNALGQRVRKSSSLGDTVFHYDTQGRLVAESSASGSPVREYLWLGDQPVAVATYQAAGNQCPATPTLDASRTFVPFARREGMEVRSGRPGQRGWEWGLGTDTRDTRASARADLDWVSGKPYAFTLSYDGAGNTRVSVRNGTSELFTLASTGGMDVGNALRFTVRSGAGLGVRNRIALNITSIDGQSVADTLELAGSRSEVTRVYAGASFQDGYTVEGTVIFTFPKAHPPPGSRLDLTVTAGNVQCQGQATNPTATLYYVHADHLNTPRAVTDEQQRVVWRWENQEPFGKSPPEENPSGLGAFEFPLRFPGQYRDAETGLFYNYFRDYDPQTGRYLQSDPIGLLGGINPYLYVAGNPLRYVDPLGLLPICRNALLGVTQNNYQEVIEAILWSLRFYVPGSPKPSAGPPLIPPRPPFPPVAPKPEFEWVPYDLQFVRQDTYQVSELIRNLLVICKEILKDACGRTREFTTSFNRTEREEERTLIDTRYFRRVTKLPSDDVPF